MQDQEQLVLALRTIQEVAKTPGKNDKIKLLKKNGSDYLRGLLLLTYNKYQTYRIQKIEQPSQYNSVQPDTYSKFQELCTKLASHTIGSNEAKVEVKRFLEQNTEEFAEVFTNVLLRDLRMGIDEKSINKAFPALIPTFEVMLASKLEDFDSIPYPCITETKMDGCRVIAIYDGDETVKFFSREGREFDECGVIAVEIKALAPGLPAVYDGEMIAYKPNMSNKTCAKNIDGNWPFFYGLSLLKTDDKTKAEVRNHLKFYIWDVIDHSYFTTSGVKGTAEKLIDRKTRLTSLFTRHNMVFNNIEMLPNAVVNNKHELLARFRELKDQGAEGLMVKFFDSLYEFKRSKQLLKVKEFFNIDLRIVGVEEGAGKYEGMLGAIVLEDDTGVVKTKCGTGFTDMDRAELYVEFLAGRLLGKIAEITGQETTKDGSVRFPAFVCLRDDKTTTNIESAV